MERSPFAETPGVGVRTKTRNCKQKSKITKKNEKSEPFHYHCVRSFFWLEAGVEDFETYEDFKSQKIRQKIQVSNKNPTLIDVKIGTILDDFQTMSVMPMHIIFSGNI